MTTTDPLAPLEALAERYESDAAHEGYGGELWSTTAISLRAAIAEARALLGEVNAREEFGIVDWGGDPIVDRDWTCVGDAMRGVRAHGYKVAPGRVVKRTVTTTTHTSEWEVVEP